MRQLFFFRIPRASEPLQKALQALEDGRRQEAEEIATKSAARVQELQSRQDKQYMIEESDLARLYASLGDLPLAIEALRRAVQVPARGDFERHQLSLRLRTQLGELLLHAGKEEEAQQTLEDCVKRRRELLGPDSLGAALGEAPLAELYFATSQLEAAEGLAERSMLALFRENAPQAFPVVALRAAIRAARYGDERPLLEAMRPLTEETSRTALIQACLRRSLRDAPRYTSLVLEELKERIEDASPTEALLPSVVSTLRRAASALGAHQKCVELLSWQLRRFEAAGDAQQALGARLELALAKDSAQDPSGALAEILEAKQRAPQVGELALLRVLRSHAKLLAQQERLSEAQAPLLEATSRCEALPKSEETQHLLGSLFLTRALYAQHQNTPHEAQPLWERALSLLPPLHPDLPLLREHLRDLSLGRACRCALLREVERTARAQLPLGLLGAVRFVEERLQLDFTSPPTQKELEIARQCASLAPKEDPPKAAQE